MRNGIALEIELYGTIKQNGHSDIPQGSKRSLEEDSHTPPRSRELKIITTYTVEAVNSEIVQEEISVESCPVDAIPVSPAASSPQSIKDLTAVTKPVGESADEMASLSPFPDAFAPVAADDPAENEVLRNVEEISSSLNKVIPRRLWQQFNCDDEDDEDMADVFGGCSDKECTYTKVCFFLNIFQRS